MPLFLISRTFVHAENDFNQIKENFLVSQRKTNASRSPDQVIMCTCPFTSSNQAFNSQPENCPYLQEKGNQVFHFVSF